MMEQSPANRTLACRSPYYFGIPLQRQYLDFHRADARKVSSIVPCPDFITFFALQTEDSEMLTYRVR